MNGSHKEEFVQSYTRALPATAFRVYSLNRLVGRLLSPRGRVLDYGCGGGYLLQHLSQLDPGIAPEGLEVSKRLVELARANNPSAAIYNSDHHLANDYYDCAYTLDVIEHIADDEGALQTLYRSLKPGGRILVAVPAHQSLFTDFDTKMGHFRRYELNELHAKLNQAGFKEVKLRYWNWLGYVAVKASSALKKSTRADNKNTLLRWWFTGIENHLNPRRGLTLIATASKLL